MLIWTAKFSKKKAVAAVIFMGVVMAVLIVLMGRTPEEAETPRPQLTGNVQRVEYLRSLGWEVEEEPIETLQFLFPEKLEEPYLSYNELQLPQGFDLRECLGRQVSRYTYAVLNHPSRAEGVQANLYLCEGVPAAGDLFCPGSGGFQDPLIPGGTEEGR
ncbi:MAG: DUF4830 domain-containing protein [Oscillibacter sp.]|nr:DUF4830 domain-containing protein [Oscillibacter sp.]